MQKERSDLRAGNLIGISRFYLTNRNSSSETAKPST
jgi:hypothetical protein